MSPSTQREMITFPGVNSSMCTPEILNGIRRLHINQGHCSREDLVRTLACYGGTSASMTAANHLQCEWCQRNRPPGRHRPAKPPRIAGQFNDIVRSDSFWCHALHGEPIVLCGMIDDTTSYHICFRLKNKEPDTCMEGVRMFWMMPFGIPHEMVVDRDGMYFGSFAERMEKLGCLLHYVPADSHHQLGKAERHNAVWRHVFEKLVDGARKTAKVFAVVAS
jgi:hypothetical protein